MANLDYKPLFSGGGAEDNIIFTTSIDKPVIGTSGKLYIFTDKDQRYWWDPRTQAYKLLGAVGGQESKIGGTTANFPFPGQKGIIYIDGEGKKYIWDDSQGITWIQTNNFRYYTEEEAAMVPDNNPYIIEKASEMQIPLVRTNQNGKSVLAEYIMYHFIDKGAVGKTYPLPPQNPTKMQFPGGFFGQPFFINIPCRETGSTTRYPGYYLPNKINAGEETTSYRAVIGSYIPIS